MDFLEKILYEVRALGQRFVQEIVVKGLYDLGKQPGVYIMTPLGIIALIALMNWSISNAISERRKNPATSAGQWLGTIVLNFLIWTAALFMGYWFLFNTEDPRSFMARGMIVFGEMTILFILNSIIHSYWRANVVASLLCIVSWITVQFVIYVWVIQLMLDPTPIVW